MKRGARVEVKVADGAKPAERDKISSNSIASGIRIYLGLRLYSKIVMAYM